ncbi:MAG: 23S rRNA (pseudouridine(1915)-N(3))-methyltransferase RlmH [Ruminococcaceae bacterium]|nr:23S rRNA (pseudouridine(1915)-N(3))-methyltransferase RlmH [Oscillospiraceae bacterium]
MKISIIAVGKLKEKYLRDAVAEYTKRISAFAKISITEINEYRCYENPSSAEIGQVLQKEGEQIISKIPKGSFVIPMCIEGVQKTSEEFSAEIEKISLTNSDITFIIGGSFGLSDEVKSLGKLKMSFSKMTFPHQLMRVILLEQVYRALSISNNTKYHK